MAQAETEYERKTDMKGSSKKIQDEKKDEFETPLESEWKCPIQYADLVVLN